MNKRSRAKLRLTDILRKDIWTPIEARKWWGAYKQKIANKRTYYTFKREVEPRSNAMEFL